ncbi:inositol monophosphatase [Candidatus Bipolaricaulota bacterium]|nr:inositol monophosphatase [Candidatus Bipolaricaulota bacterium]MBS3814096.1 inositol monophosphatase [Candidatus Bipolaricaulota bacterium]MBS3825199.1 inositol monophosphatase [Candidatus Bipolaricaulota bacterium]
MAEELLELARSAAEDAGEMLLEGLKKSRKVSQKSGPADLVTQYDHSAQDLIANKIQKKFPKHSILAEEEFEVEKSSTKWIVDPLDGTTNYIYNYPLFCVSIAVEQDGELTAGVVHLPVLEETFTAMKGKGAFLNGHKISVSGTRDFSKSLLATGFPYDEDRMPSAIKSFSGLVRKARGIRRDGAAAMDLAFVAAGRFDGFWELGLSPWDVAAGCLIIKEAGGTISDFSGEGYDIYGTQGLVATNGRIQNALVKKLIF